MVLSGKIAIEQCPIFSFGGIGDQIATRRGQIRIATYRNRCIFGR